MNHKPSTVQRDKGGTYMRIKKSYKKLSILVCLLTVMSFIFAACGSSKNESTSTDISSVSQKEAEFAVEDFAVYPEDAVAGGTAEQDTGIVSSAALDEAGLSYNELNKTTASGNNSSAKLIKTVNISLQTKELDALLEELKAYVTEYEGYIEYSNIYGIGLENLRSGNLTIRIPVEHLEVFVEKTRAAGTVTNISESTVDVTLEYVDVENHKKALEIEQERLYEILEQAETVEELIAVEQRLSQVRYEMEWYTTSLNTYDNQINYSTVDIYLVEVERISKVEEEGIWAQIKSKFSDNIYSMANGAKSLFVWFAGSTPYFLALAIVVVVIVIFIKRKKKGKRKKQDNNDID